MKKYTKAKIEIVELKQNVILTSVTITEVNRTEEYTGVIGTSY